MILFVCGLRGAMGAYDTHIVVAESKKRAIEIINEQLTSGSLRRQLAHDKPATPYPKWNESEPEEIGNLMEEGVVSSEYNPPMSLSEELESLLKDSIDGCLPAHDVITELGNLVPKAKTLEATIQNLRLTVADLETQVDYLEEEKEQIEMKYEKIPPFVVSKNAEVPSKVTQKEFIVTLSYEDGSETTFEYVGQTQRSHAL